MVNFIQLLADMRAHVAFGTRFGISTTLAPDLWYLQRYDAKGLLAYVDWLGFMSYDLHGMWDADLPQIGKYVYGQASLGDISRDMIPLRFALTPADMQRVNFGLVWYGRGYQLADPNCTRADGTCAWIDGSEPGRCTAQKGVMSLVEIRRLIKEKQLTPVPLEDGKGRTAMKQITWVDQWIGYDDTQTIQQKIDWANRRCFGGTMYWSVDLEAGNLDDAVIGSNGTSTALGAVSTAMNGVFASTDRSSMTMKTVTLSTMGTSTATSPVSTSTDRSSTVKIRARRRRICQRFKKRLAV